MGMECAVVPLRGIEVKIELLKKIATAIREAKEAGVTNPEALIRKILHSRSEYKAWKDCKKR